MKLIIEFKKWNPVLNKQVSDFIYQNKELLFDLWNLEESEEENIKFLTSYFTEYPELMNTKFDLKDITSINRQNNIKNMAPKLMNIGGVKDFRSF